MEGRQGLVTVVGVIGLIFLVSLAMWVWVTMPADRLPEELPSNVLAPPSSSYGDAVEKGRSVARSLTAEEKLPGLSLAVAVNGEIVWAEAFGWANLENETPLTPAMLFRIGGVSQTLTAAAVGLLSERGRLDLDAPVQRYVPGFPEKEWPISTRQLMAHTAGIRTADLEDGSFRTASCVDDAERLALFAALPLRFRPGTGFYYSTYGWVLVGAVVTAAANEPYLDFMQREILKPTGMESTVADGGGQTDIAHFYFPRMMLNPRYGLQDAPPVALSCILAGAGFLSTPLDLVRFGSAMVGDALLSASVIEELQERELGWEVGRVALGTSATPTRVVGQGLGAAVRRGLLSANTVGGHVPGGTASLMIIPEHRIAIAVTTNVSGAGTPSLLTARLAEVFIR
jgi:serine beta-lactamase-like protein LACTB, mitochondrial